MTSISRRRLLRWSLIGASTATIGLVAACGGGSAGGPPQPESAKSAGAPATTGKPAETAKTEAAKPAESKSAAAPTTGSKTPVTLRMHMRSGTEKSEPAIYVDRPGEWMQETGHKVELEPIPGGKDYVPKIMALAAGNTIGDALFTGDAYSEHTFLVRNDIIEPVDDYLGRFNVKKAEWIKPIIDTLTHDGKMYGLPKASNPAHSFINVNLTMFKEAGLKEPETYSTTFEQLQEWSIKLSKGPKDRRDVYGYYAAIETSHPITNAVRQWGGDLVDKDGLNSLVDQEPFWNWLQWTTNLIVKEGVHPLGGVVKAGDSNALAGMFGAGKLAMMHSHRAWQRSIKEAIKDKKIDMAVIQYPRGPKPLGWVSNVDTHSGTRVSKFKDETFGLIYAMADRRFAYLVAKTQGYLTGRVDNLEAIKELADDPFIKVQAKNDTQQEAWWRAKNLRAYEVEAELLNMLDLIWAGKRQPDKAFVKELKQSMDAVLAKPAL